MNRGRPILVPEPKKIRFSGRWYNFNGFTNMSSFLMKEFGVSLGRWEIIREGVDVDKVYIVVEENRVRFYGDERIAYATILQLVKQYRDRLPEVEIEEKMSFRFRGFHLDVARGGVPTVETLKKILRLLFLLKYNYFALYLEDLFPWNKYPDIGVLRGRYTEDELREVVEYGLKLGIEVFPSLELCGHMENILSLPSYSMLSEWWHPREGVINVIDNRAREFVHNLLEEVLNFFPGRYIHIGGDEVWALGRGRSLDVTREFRGPQLYEEYYRELINIVRSKGKIPMIWGDMIMSAYMREDEARYWRKLIESSIWRDTIIVNWDYGVNPKNYFVEKIRILSTRGLKQIVAPGLWNWNRFYPDFITALSNIESFLSAAREEGVEGFLITAWGDDGAECLFSFLEPLLLASIEIAEGTGEWEDKWVSLIGEDPKVLNVRKIFGKVSTVVHRWREYWGIWLPKHILLKTDILKLVKYYSREDIEKLVPQLEEAINMSKDVELPPDLDFMKRFYIATLKAIKNNISVQDYIELSNIYTRLWLNERKIQGLDAIIKKFWGAAGVTRIENINAQDL
ncbi:MAG: beta-N-acetylhexosaminidase [Ignisphaera sp.]